MIKLCIWILRFNIAFKTLKEDAFLTDSGNWFPSLGAEYETDSSNIAVLNLATA